MKLLVPGWGTWALGERGIFTALPKKSGLNGDRRTVSDTRELWVGRHFIIQIASIAAAAALWRDAVHAQDRTSGAALAGGSLAVPSRLGQETPRPQRVDIPTGATSLEGIPTVRIDSAEGSTTRQILDAAEAAKARLTVRVVDGQFYWTTRDNRLLRLNSSGEFTYLSSEPGQYIRFTRLSDKISYVEHVDLTSGSVTWFGELRIVVGK